MAKEQVSFPCKYDRLAQSCFGKAFSELDLDERIAVEDMYEERK